MTRPLLYTYRRCPYAMRARMALLVAGIEVDAFEIVLRDKPAEMLAASPKGTVPVLCLPDGRVIDESWDIMRWALDGGPWWTSAQSAANLALRAGNDGAFKRQLDGYKYPERENPTDPASARCARREEAVTTFLEPLNARLSAEPFLGGVQPCATDLALFPFVRQFAAVEPDWFKDQPLPALHHWLQSWLAHPLFLACMRKLPVQQRVPMEGASA